MGRKALGGENGETKRVTVRIADTELAGLKEAAKRNGYKYPSEYLRALVGEALATDADAAGVARAS